MIPIYPLKLIVLFSSIVSFKYYRLEEGKIYFCPGNNNYSRILSIDFENAS